MTEDEILQNHHKATFKAWGIFAINLVVGLYAVIYGPTFLAAILYASAAFQALAHERAGYWLKVAHEMRKDDEL